MLLASDRSLLEQFRAGDRQAMERVFHHYSGVLARHLQAGFRFHGGGQAMRFTGIKDRYDLHDLVAETFRRAFEEPARLGYDGLGSYETYLRTIAHNMVIDRLRANAASAGRTPSLLAVEENTRCAAICSPE
ncbi:MAG: sigma factor [Pseudomonadota bacterium]